MASLVKNFQPEYWNTRYKFSIYEIICSSGVWLINSVVYFSWIQFINLSTPSTEISQQMQNVMTWIYYYSHLMKALPWQSESVPGYETLRDSAFFVQQSIASSCVMLLWNSQRLAIWFRRPSVHPAATCHDPILIWLTMQFSYSEMLRIRFGKINQCTYVNLRKLS